MARISAVCLYCGSAVGTNPRFAEQAARLGELLAARGITLVYGGGAIGLMGVAARAVLAAGGKVIGIIPRFLQSAEKGLTSATRLEVVESMHERKARMFALSDGVIVLPGGMGTLDELFEMLTWRQLHLHDKPIVIVDIDDYWRPFLRLVEHAVATGFAPQRSLTLFRMVSGVEEALRALAESPEPAEPAIPPARL